ncbi:MAG: RNA chaperone Hfq [Acidobacteriota bacterium]|nr:RNA chaperone Hfq [Acidobacteriota bacterium]
MAYQNKSGSASSHRPGFNYKKRQERPQGPQGHRPPPGRRERLDHTGAETSWLQELVKSRAQVTVVMQGGERLQGHIRYHDRDCFSIGLSPTGPRFLLRKENIAYIVEDLPASAPPPPPVDGEGGGPDDAPDA